LVGPFALGKFAQYVQRLLLGGTDKAAGVYDQHLGMRGIVHGVIAVAHEELCHRIGIDGIFGAAQ
jgi:hypothetical protein